MLKDTELHDALSRITRGLALPLCATLLSVALTWLAPASAWATDNERVEALVLAGVEEFKAERFGEAVSRFLEAKLLYDDPNLDWNIARAFEELGDCANARYWFEHVKERKPGQGDDKKKVKQNAKAAKKKLDEMASCPAANWLKVVCDDPGARVQIDQRPPLACPASLLLALGEHEVVVSLEGRETQQKIVSVKEGDDTLVQFPTLPKPVEVVQVQPTPEPPPPPPSWTERRTALFWGGIGTGAAGVLMFGTSFYFSSVTEEKQSQYDALIAQPSLTDAERNRADTLREDGELNATIANALRFGGLGLVGVGVTMVVVDLVLDDGGEPDAGGTALLVLPTSGGATVGLSLAF